MTPEHRAEDHSRKRFQLVPKMLEPNPKLKEQVTGGVN